MSNYLKGKRCMVWAFMQNARMWQAFEKYGDRIDTVGVFTFEVDATGTISETGTPIPNMLPYITKWLHIKWIWYATVDTMTVAYDGTITVTFRDGSTENVKLEVEQQCKSKQTG